jgi:hypothetical protein
MWVGDKEIGGWRGENDDVILGFFFDGYVADGQKTALGHMGKENWCPLTRTTR